MCVPEWLGRLHRPHSVVSWTTLIIYNEGIKSVSQNRFILVGALKINGSLTDSSRFRLKKYTFQQRYTLSELYNLSSSNQTCHALDTQNEQQIFIRPSIQNYTSLTISRNFAKFVIDGRFYPSQYEIWAECFKCSERYNSAFSSPEFLVHIFQINFAFHVCPVQRKKKQPEKTRATIFIRKFITA